MPDQYKVDESYNLRTKSIAEGIDVVANARDANSRNLEVVSTHENPKPTLEYEPIELFIYKNSFETLSNLNESDGSNVETDLSTTVASQLSNSEKVWIKQDESGLFILNRTNKQTIILNSKNKVFDALLDTGSDRCLLNYRNLKYINPCEIIKPSICLIRGVKKESKNNVIGEVDLIFKLNNNISIKTNALIINDGDFNTTSSSEETSLLIQY